MLPDPHSIYPEVTDQEATNEVSAEDEMEIWKSVVRKRFLQLAARTLTVGKLSSGITLYSSTVSESNDDLCYLE